MEAKTEGDTVSKHYDVELIYSVRVSQDDTEEGELTAEAAERIARVWMEEPENCNERVIVRHNGRTVRVSEDGHVVPGSCGAEEVQP